MAADPEDQRLLTRSVIRALEDRTGQIRDIVLVPPEDVLRVDPLITGVLIRSEANRNYTLAIQDAETSPVAQRVYAALTADEMNLLQEVACDIGDHASGDYKSEQEIPPHFDVWDGMRSSVGQDYVLTPDSAGWHTLRGDRVIEVSVRYVTDPELQHQVRMEMDEDYALAQSFTNETEEDFAADMGIITPDEHFETDSGTPPEGDPGLAAERALASNRRVGWTDSQRSLAAEIPGACDITGQ